MNSPLNISITEVSKEGLSIETSILKDGATINFDKELEKAKKQAASTDTQWQNHDSVWESLNKKYGV